MSDLTRFHLLLFAELRQLAIWAPSLCWALKVLDSSAFLYRNDGD